MYETKGDNEMTKREAVKLLRSEKEIVALDSASYALFLALVLELLYQGYDVAKVTLAGAKK